MGRQASTVVAQHNSTEVGNFARAQSKNTFYFNATVSYKPHHWNVGINRERDTKHKVISLQILEGPK